MRVRVYLGKVQVATAFGLGNALKIMGQLETGLFRVEFEVGTETVSMARYNYMVDNGLTVVVAGVDPADDLRDSAS